MNGLRITYGQVTMDLPGELFVDQSDVEEFVEALTEHGFTVEVVEA